MKLKWYGAGVVAAIAVAWFASLVHASGHAPLGLVSLGVGAVLGAAVSVIARKQQVAGGRQLVGSVIVFAIVAIVAEHAWLYLDYRHEWLAQTAKSPQVAIFRTEPLPPTKYFAHEWSPQNAALWCLDAVLIVAGAVGTVFVWRGQRAPEPDI
ncbi:MAG TPA: hypothetical protein VHE81_02805 [Lacipirellulaceae bacterium]|nr:hypothetical protein [Lacipirellulaceae bacterium]